MRYHRRVETEKVREQTAATSVSIAWTVAPNIKEIVKIRPLIKPETKAYSKRGPPTHYSEYADGFCYNTNDKRYNPDFCLDRLVADQKRSLDVVCKIFLNPQKSNYKRRVA